MKLYFKRYYTHVGRVAKNKSTLRDRGDRNFIGGGFLQGLTLDTGWYDVKLMKSKTKAPKQWSMMVLEKDDHEYYAPGNQGEGVGLCIKHLFKVLKWKGGAPTKLKLAWRGI